MPMVNSGSDNQDQHQCYKHCCSNDLTLGSAILLKQLCNIAWRWLFDTGLQQWFQCRGQALVYGLTLHRLQSEHEQQPRGVPTFILKLASLLWCSSGLLAPSAFLSSLSMSCDSSLAMVHGRGELCTAPELVQRRRCFVFGSRSSLELVLKKYLRDSSSTLLNFSTRFSKFINPCHLKPCLEC